MTTSTPAGPPDMIDLLDRCDAGFASRVAQVRPDQWDAATPCEGWTCRDLVGHVIGGNRMTVAAFSGAPRADAMPAGRDTEGLDDPRPTYEQTAAAVRAMVTEPGALERMVEHPRMTMPGAAMLEFRISDVLVHTWDLARAIGADEDLDPVLVEFSWALTQSRADMLAKSGTFGEGPSGDVGPDAPLQARLLDLLGRRP